MAESKEAVSPVDLEDIRRRLESHEILDFKDSFGLTEDKWDYIEKLELEKNLANNQKPNAAEHSMRKENDEEKGFVAAASEVLHDVAEKTKDFVHEVKGKIFGHFTDYDISLAAMQLNELKDKLAHEQHELREIQLAALVAEQALNVKDYEALKEEEMKARKAERATELKIHEAIDYLELVTNERRLQQLRQKCHEREHKPKALAPKSCNAAAFALSELGATAYGGAVY